ncbi:MAG: FG-GAP-like repeat-containing protein [Proteobacteria bacterium]|nr:FG-GAP-like repeat-containing protein [Pseudomonadota bacterium]
MKNRRICIVAAVAALLSPLSSGWSQELPPINEFLTNARVIGGVNHESGARLMDPVVIDFNGDGIDDWVIGAPGMSPNGIASAGSVFILLGKKDRPLQGDIDLTQWHDFDYRFDGDQVNGQLGINIVTGDFNGDGWMDLAIAEPGSVGRIHVIHSRKDIPKGIHAIGQAGIVDVSFYTTQPDSYFGLTMCVGDFNRDGIDDLVAGYLSSTSTMGPRASNVILLTMRRQWAKKSFDIASKLFGKTIMSRPVARNVRALHTCAIGDFNDDGLLDIALGMPIDTFDRQESVGSVAIVYHPFKYSGMTLNLGEPNPTWGIRLIGSQPGAQFGYSLASGDFTGDGRDDLAVSAPNRLIRGPDAEGAVYIFEGSKWPQSSGIQPDSLQISGQGGSFGFKLQTHDVNRDNRPDLVVSAPFVQIAGAPEAGAVNIYLGGPHFVGSLNQSSRPDMQIVGHGHMHFGMGSAFGDFNGNGLNDAIFRTASDIRGRTATGSYVVLGDVNALPTPKLLDTAEFLTITAPSQGGGLSPTVRRVQYNGKEYLAWLSRGGFVPGRSIVSRSVICLFEVDQAEQDRRLDTPDDCGINIIGPEGEPIVDFSIDDPTHSGTAVLTISLPGFAYQDAIGVVAAIPLPKQIDKPLVLNLTPQTLATEAMTFILPGEAYADLGRRLEWVDLDGDGQLELLIGAPERSEEDFKAGALFVVPGFATFEPGIRALNDPKQGITIYEGSENEALATQWLIADLNANGKPDIVLLGSQTTNAIGEQLSTAYVLYDAGYRRPKTYSIRSPELGALRIVAPRHRAGLELIQMADVNGDGFPDLILLSPNFRAGLQKQGMIYVILADPSRKSGELSLTNEALVNFSLSPNRNDRIADARFIRENGRLRLFVIIESLLTRQFSLQRFSPATQRFSGHISPGMLQRDSTIRPFDTPAQFISLQNDASSDDLWLLFPYMGLGQSDQGIAQRFRLRTTSPPHLPPRPR